MASQLAFLKTPLLVCALLGSQACQAPDAPEATGLAAGPVRAPDPGRALRAAYVQTIQNDAGADYALAEAGAAGSLRLENRLQRFSAEFSPAGVGILPAAGAEGAGRLALSLARFGCAEQLEAATRVVPSVSKNRVEYRREAVTEWYVNGPLGVEQGFAVPRALGCAGSGALLFELELGPELHAQKVVPPDGGEPWIAFVNGQGQRQLKYTDAYASDARGVQLPVEVAVSEGRVQLRVLAAGAVYPLSVDPLIWAEQQKLLPGDSALNDNAGTTVAISGDTAVVGAPMVDADPATATDTGAAYVFLRTGSTWTLQQKLTLAAPVAADNFGISVAIDGDTVLVGAHQVDLPGKMNAGAAYVFVRSAGVWGAPQQLTAGDAAAADRFGNAVALYADTAAVGASLANLPGKADAGAVYIFERSAGTWMQKQKLTAGDATASDSFGDVVSLYADTVLVGAQLADVGGLANVGAAYVFTRAAGAWSPEQKITSSDGIAEDRFAAAISLGADTAVIGAHQADLPGKSNAGAVYVYTRNLSVWGDQQKLVAGDSATGDHFGYSVAVTGDTAVIGSYQANLPGKADAGAAYVFTRAGLAWTQQQKLTASDAVASDQLGAAAAISGDTALVGANLVDVGAATNAGAAYAFRLALPNGDACTTDGSCHSGYCRDGVCCNSDCGAGATSDCQACSKSAGAAADGTCGPRTAGIVCRSATDLCDAAEKCDGAALACPKDDVLPATSVCRTATELCDAEEKCDGTTVVCPADAVRPATDVCRVAADICDVEEKCDGLTVVCPANGFKPDTTECRGVAGVCDVAEKCTGAAAACPADGFEPDTTECRGVAGVCDVAEKCTGAAAACPADGFEPDTTECRGAAGVCDVAEKCTGAAAACPADGFEPSSTVCRNAAGVCDVAEKCTGAAAACPGDLRQDAGVSCRGAVSMCDAVESCDGSSVDCPTDVSVADSSACDEGTCQQGSCRAESELAVALTANPERASLQEPLSVVATVSNLGKVAAKSVSVQLTLPGGATLSSAKGEGWDCQSAGQQVTCTQAFLVVGTAAPITLVLVPPLDSARFDLSASVTSTTYDPSSANNSAVLSVDNSNPLHPGLGGGGLGCSITAPGAHAASHPTSQSPGWLGAGILFCLLALRRRALSS